MSKTLRIVSLLGIILILIMLGFVPNSKPNNIELEFILNKTNDALRYNTANQSKQSESFKSKEEIKDKK